MATIFFKVLLTIVLMTLIKELKKIIAETIIEHKKKS